MRVEIEADLVVVAEEDIVAGSQIIINKGTIVALVLPRRARRPLAIETDYTEAHKAADDVGEFAAAGMDVERIEDWDGIEEFTEEPVAGTTNERRQRGRPRGSTKNPFAPKAEREARDEGEAVPPEAWGQPKLGRPVEGRRPLNRDDIVAALQTRPYTTRQMTARLHAQGLAGDSKDHMKRLREAGLVVAVSDDRFPLYGLLGAEYPERAWAAAKEKPKAPEPEPRNPASLMGPIRDALADRKALTMQDIGAALNLNTAAQEWKRFIGTVGIMVNRGYLKKIELNGVTLLTLPDEAKETSAVEGAEETGPTEA